MINTFVKPAVRSIRKNITTFFIKVLIKCFKHKIFVKHEFIDLALRDGLTDTEELKEIIRSHGGGFSVEEAIQFEMQRGTFTLAGMVGNIVNTGRFNAGDILSVMIDTKKLPFVQLIEVCLQKNYFETRQLYSALYLKGDGIEIGALNKPLKVPASVKVSYVDRVPNDMLKEHYSDIDSFLNVDIVDNGEKLATISDSTQDFVIANHFLEHCENVIEALNNMLRVLKLKGILYLAVPNKCYTFDKDRQTSDFEHILRDFNDGPEISRETHYRDWAEHVVMHEHWNAHCREKSPSYNDWLAGVDDLKKQEYINRWTTELMSKDYSIHFHVWSQTEILEMLALYKPISMYDFKIITVTAHSDEIIIILERGKT